MREIATFKIPKKQWEYLQGLVNIKNLKNFPKDLRPDRYGGISVATFSFDDGYQLSMVLVSDGKIFDIRCTGYNSDGTEDCTWYVDELTDTINTLVHVEGKEPLERVAKFIIEDEEKKWYTIKFSAKLDEDDVRAMKSCFFDAMNESMDIYELADFEITEEE